MFLAGLAVTPGMAAATLSVSPSSGVAGTWVTATGSSFAYGGDIEFPPPVTLRFNGVIVASGWNYWDPYSSTFGWNSFRIPFQVPPGTSPGTYTVQASAYSRQASTTFTVASFPTADFTMNPSRGRVPLTVYFTDNSAGSPTSWFWDFGDGSTSTQRNPVHTYSSTGTYTVLLTVSNSAGRNTDSASVTAYMPTLVVSPSSGNAGTPLKVTGSSFNLYGVEFPQATILFNGIVRASNVPMTRSGTLGSFTVDFPVPAGTAPGSYTIRAVGPLDSAETTFTITNSPPHAVIDANPMSGKTPLTVQFRGTQSYDEDGSISSYRWDFGDDTSAMGPTSEHTYHRSGIYRVRLTVTDNEQQSGTASITVNAENTPPVADARADPTSGSRPPWTIRPSVCMYRHWFGVPSTSTRRTPFWGCSPRIRMTPMAHLFPITGTSETATGRTRPLQPIYTGISNRTPQYSQ